MLGGRARVKGDTSEGSCGAPRRRFHWRPLVHPIRRRRPLRGPWANRGLDVDPSGAPAAERSIGERGAGTVLARREVFIPASRGRGRAGRSHPPPSCWRGVGAARTPQASHSPTCSCAPVLPPNPIVDAGGSGPRPPPGRTVGGPAFPTGREGPAPTGEETSASSTVVGAFAGRRAGRERATASNGRLSTNAKTTADVRGASRASPRGAILAPSPRRPRRGAHVPGRRAEADTY